MTRRSYHYHARRWQIPAPRQFEKMCWAATIGWIVLTFVVLGAGNFDLIRYLIVGAMLTDAQR